MAKLQELGLTIPESSVPQFFIAPIVPEPTLLQRCQTWADRNRALIGIICIGSGVIATGFVIRHNTRNANRKRRAKRGSNGKKVEAVLTLGDLNDPLLKSVTLDLERRGFVVFCVVHERLGEQTILREGNTDIRALHVDIEKPSNAIHTLETLLHTSTDSSDDLHLLGAIVPVKVDSNADTFNASQNQVKSELTDRCFLLNGFLRLVMHILYFKYTLY